MPPWKKNMKKHEKKVKTCKNMKSYFRDFRFSFATGGVGKSKIDKMTFSCFCMFFHVFSYLLSSTDLPRTNALASWQTSAKENPKSQKPGFARRKRTFCVVSAWNSPKYHQFCTYLAISTVLPRFLQHHKLTYTFLLACSKHI